LLGCLGLPHRNRRDDLGRLAVQQTLALALHPSPNCRLLLRRSFPKPGASHVPQMLTGMIEVQNLLPPREVLAALLPDPLCPVGHDRDLTALMRPRPHRKRVQTATERGRVGESRHVARLLRTALWVGLVDAAQLRLPPRPAGVDEDAVHTHLHPLGRASRKDRCCITPLQGALHPLLVRRRFPLQLLTDGARVARDGAHRQPHPADNLQLPRRLAETQVTGEPAQQRHDRGAQLPRANPQVPVQRAESLAASAAMVVGTLHA